MNKAYPTATNWFEVECGGFKISRTTSVKFDQAHRTASLIQLKNSSRYQPAVCMWRNPKLNGMLERQQM